MLFRRHLNVCCLERMGCLRAYKMGAASPRRISLLKYNAENYLQYKKFRSNSPKESVIVFMMKIYRQVITRSILHSNSPRVRRPRIHIQQNQHNSIMTSSNTFFCALLALCVGNPPAAGGFPSQRPLTRSFDVDFDQQTVEQTTQTPVFWDATAVIMTSLLWHLSIIVCSMCEPRVLRKHILSCTVNVLL